MWCREMYRLGRDYPGPVSSQRVPGGVVHKLPVDLREALIANATALAAWKDITPLARNEFICWVEDAKQEIDPRAPHSPDPGGAGGRPAPALLLAGVQAPRARRQVGSGRPIPVKKSSGGEPLAVVVGEGVVALVSSFKPRHGERNEWRRWPG